MTIQFIYTGGVYKIQIIIKRFTQFVFYSLGHTKSLLRCGNPKYINVYIQAMLLFILIDKK